MKKLHPYRRMLELNIPVYGGIVRPEDLRGGLRRAGISEKMFAGALGSRPVPSAGGVFAGDVEDILLNFKRKEVNAT